MNITDEQITETRILASRILDTLQTAYTTENLKHIYKTPFGWSVQLSKKNVKYQKQFKTKDEAMEYRDELVRMLRLI